MASGICYTWSGDKKIYESILGPKLGVYREGGNFGPITTDAFTLSLTPSNVMCMYEIKVKGDDYILSENNPMDYLVVRYGGVDKLFGYKKKDKKVTINVTGNISVSGTSYYAQAHANISVPCDVTVKILYTKIKNGMSDDLSVNLTINKNSAEATKLIGKTSDIGQIILNSVTGSPTTFGSVYTFNYSKV